MNNKMNKRQSEKKMWGVLSTPPVFKPKCEYGPYGTFNNDIGSMYPVLIKSQGDST